MNKIDEIKVGEVYWLEKKGCYSLIVDGAHTSVHHSRYLGEDVVRTYIFTRLSQVTKPSYMDGVMMLHDTPEDILVTITVDGKEISFGIDSIRNFEQEDVEKLFSDKPVYVLPPEDTEKMLCKLFGPKCPFSGNRCSQYEGCLEIPGIDQYLILPKYEQGSD